jgi:hypothetical protein
MTGRRNKYALRSSQSFSNALEFGFRHRWRAVVFMADVSEMEKEEREE